MRILELPEIRSLLVYRDIISLMRGAVIAWSRGECDMPMPMHLAIASENAEVHMKSCYRRGGRHFALKVAATFPGNLARGRAVGSGMMLLSSAETGEPKSHPDTVRAWMPGGRPAVLRSRSRDGDG